MFTPTHDVELLFLPSEAGLVLEHLPGIPKRKDGNTVAITVLCQQERDSTGNLTGGWIIDPAFTKLCQEMEIYALHTLEPRALTEAV